MTRHEEDQARKTLKNLMIGGILLAVAGIAIVYAAWPEIDLEPASSGYGDDEEDGSGSWFWMLVGACMALAGEIMLLISIIGHGVRLGRLASPSSEPAAH